MKLALTLNVNLQGELLERLVDLAYSIHRQLHTIEHTMSTEFDALSPKVDAAVAASTASKASADAAVAKIADLRQQVADLKASLPPAGGMTADEVKALSDKLDQLATDEGAEKAELDSAVADPAA